MAGVLLRLRYGSKDHFLRFANSTLLELSKRTTHGLIHDPYSALAVFSHPNAASAVISHLVTLRQFSSGRSLYSTESPLKTPRETYDTRKIIKKNDTTGGWSYNEVITIANSLSVFRLLSGPVISAWIIQGRWSVAVPALVISGATDWLDGYFARRESIRSGRPSNVLGSYLDPLADKVLVGCVVGALGYTGTLPLPLVGVVLGRDVVLLGGAFAIRAQQLGWKWPGVKEFFRITPTESSSDMEKGRGGSAEAGAAAPMAPVVKPLFVSKINTGFQLALVGACMTDAWLGWPGQQAVWGLGWSTAGTTVISCIAYGRAYLRNELLVPGSAAGGTGGGKTS
ncbi:hypothetical protein Ndes2526B_g05089 [Nannochloris sp. 'desiccata']